MPECTSKSLSISFEVLVLILLRSVLSVGMSICACCGLPVVDRNPEEFRAACSSTAEITGILMGSLKCITPLGVRRADQQGSGSFFLTLDILPTFSVGDGDGH